MSRTRMVGGEEKQNRVRVFCGNESGRGRDRRRGIAWFGLEQQPCRAPRIVDGGLEHVVVGDIGDDERYAEDRGV